MVGHGDLQNQVLRAGPNKGGNKSKKDVCTLPCTPGLERCRLEGSHRTVAATIAIPITTTTPLTQRVRRATKAQVDLFLNDPSYLALITLEREHRLLFITDLHADCEADVRAAALELRGRQLRKPPAAAQWMRLGLAQDLSLDAAATQVVSELRRIDKGFAQVATGAAQT